MNVQACNLDNCLVAGNEGLREPIAVDLFKALADPSRAAILGSLASAGRPLRVSEVSTCCPQDLSVVSRHLATLREAGVVESERRGREVWYRLETGGLVRYLRDLADAFESCCPPTSSEDGKHGKK